MSFTRTDQLNALQFAQERLKLATINRLYLQDPHLISHIKYTIRQADSRTDYFFPPTLTNRAIVTNIEMTKTICEQLSCNIAKKDGQCTQNSPPENYFVGDDGQTEVACQPSCFNLLRNPTLNEDGTEIPHMTRLRWNDGICVFVPNASTWTEIPLFRSSEIFETRVNDLPVGFNFGPDNPFSNSGLNYSYNEAYCQAFFERWSPVEKNCVTPWYRWLLNAVVGESIIKLTQAGITALQNNGNTVPPINLPPLPPVDEKYKLENWLNHINENFILPDPDITLPHSQFIATESFIGTAETATSSTEGTKTAESSTKTAESSTEGTETAASSTETAESSTEGTKGNNGNIKEMIEIEIKNFFDNADTSLSEILPYIELLAIFFVSLGVDAILDQIKKLLRMVVSRATPFITRFFTQALATQVAQNVFRTAFRMTMARMFLQLTVRVVSQFLIALARILILATSVIGIILIIVSLFDLLMMFWDPLGFNARFPPEILKDVILQSEIALRQDFGMSTVQVSFDMLNIILSVEDELIAEQFLLFEWIFEYLNALEVNSEGRRIERGPIIGGGIVEDVNIDADNARIQIPTLRDFHDFENQMNKRLTTTNQLNIIAWTLTFVAAFFYLMRTYFGALFLIIIAIFLFALASINLDQDFVIKNLPSINGNTIQF